MPSEVRCPGQTYRDMMDFPDPNDDVEVVASLTVQSC